MKTQLAIKMSIVSNIIASVCNQGLSSNKEEIINSANEARVHVSKVMRSHFVHLSSALINTVELQNQLHLAFDEMETLQSHIDKEVISNVDNSVGEGEKVVAKWREVKGELDAAKCLLEIHELLDSSYDADNAKEYTKAAQFLAQASDALISVSTKEIESQLDILSSMNEEVIIRKGQLVETLNEVWKTSIIWKEEDHAHDCKSVVLCVRDWCQAEAGKTNLQDAMQMITAMHSLGILKTRVKHLAKNIMHHFVRPVLLENHTITTTNENNYSIIQIDKRKNKDSDTAAMQLKHYVMQIHILFDFLHSVLFKFSINDDGGGSDDDGGDGRNILLMKYLADEIRDDFNRVLLKDCLSSLVPTTSLEFKQFDNFKDVINELQEYFISIGFYSQSEQPLLQFASNIDVVFSNKSCAHILATARKLIMQPLHVTVCVTPMDKGMAIKDMYGNVMQSSSEKLLADHTLNFPPCQISKSSCDLVELLYSTMEEACKSSAEYAGRLCCTVRNILNMYCHVVPQAHKYNISNIPLYAALVHNNSMFLSHHSLLLGSQFRGRLPPPLQDVPLTTCDLVIPLRTTATDIFLAAMRGHRDSLLHTIKQATDTSTLGCELSSVIEAQRSLLQCLDQLQRLHNVWADVLPKSVYTKAMGTLVGSVVEELVLKIVSLQDIFVEVATGLCNLLQLLIDKAPALFTESCTNVASTPVECLTKVRFWGKMVELVVVLSSPQNVLEERWATGKGPFALHFPPEEAKALIRALFQNSEDRAKLLAKIK